MMVFVFQIWYVETSLKNKKHHLARSPGSKFLELKGLKFRVGGFVHLSVAMTKLNIMLNVYAVVFIH